jgi:predicted nucleotidyltransferase
MGTLINDSASAALFGKTRRNILAMLFNRPEAEFYLRQIVRLSGSGRGAAQRELANLLEAGIISLRRQGQLTLYSANKNSAVYAEIKNLMARTSQTLALGSTQHNIRVPQKQLDSFCRKHHISKLAFYGSVLRDDFSPDSDVDVLVDFEPGHVPGLAFFGMQEELSKLLGRSVDLHTPADLSRRFRDSVVREAQVIYG